MTIQPRSRKAWITLLTNPDYLAGKDYSLVIYITDAQVSSLFIGPWFRSRITLSSSWLRPRYQVGLVISYTT